MYGECIYIFVFSTISNSLTIHEITTYIVAKYSGVTLLDILILRIKYIPASWYVDINYMQGYGI